MPKTNNTIRLDPIRTEADIKDALQKELAILLERSMENKLSSGELAEVARAMVAIATFLLERKSRFTFTVENSLNPPLGIRVQLCDFLRGASF